MLNYWPLTNKKCFSVENITLPTTLMMKETQQCFLDWALMGNPGVAVTSTSDRGPYYTFCFKMDIKVATSFKQLLSKVLPFRQKNLPKDRCIYYKKLQYRNIVYLSVAGCDICPRTHITILLCCKLLSCLYQ